MKVLYSYGQNISAMFCTQLFIIFQRQMEFAMTALFVARIRVQDPDKMKAYSAAVAPTIAACI